MSMGRKKKVTIIKQKKKTIVITTSIIQCAINLEDGENHLRNINSHLGCKFTRQV